MIDYFKQNPTRKEIDYDGLAQIKGLAFMDENHKLKLTGYGEQLAAHEMEFPDYDRLEEGLKKFGGEEPSMLDYFRTINEPSDLVEFLQGQDAKQVHNQTLELFEKAGAQVGLAGVESDGDMVVRHFPDFENTLSTVATNIPYISNENKKIIKYQGSSHTFKYISYFKFFMPDGVKKADIEGKIVLIGLDVKASPDVSGSQKDSFPTPFTRYDAQLIPGVELHANLISNLINNEYVIHKSNNFNLFLLTLNLIIITWVCSFWKPITTFIYGILLCSGWMAIASYLWIDGFFINSILSIPIFFLTYIASGGHAYLTEGRQKKMIKGAFA